MTYVQVQLIPANHRDAIPPVDVPESEAYPGFPEPALVIYKGRYFGNFSPGWNVVPMSYSEIQGTAFEVK